MRADEWKGERADEWEGGSAVRCVVTGVAGFIGSHLAERLIAAGHAVVGIDAFTDYYGRPLKDANLQVLRDYHHDRFTLIEADLAQMAPEALAAALDGAEWILHQAAQAGVRSSWGESFAIYTACNITATQRLLEAARRIPTLKRIVYASSSSVYGDAPTLPVTEQAHTAPVSPYGVTKLAAEHLCRLYWRNFGVPTVTLRYFTVYGPRQRPDMAFHQFGRALLTGAPLVVYGDATQTRDCTHVSDVVAANLLAVQAPADAGEDVEGEVFNIAGGARVGLRGAIARMEELLGRRAVIEHRATARGDVRDTYADITRAQRVLGYAPTMRLREGLASELAYLEALYSSPAPALTPRLASSSAAVRPAVPAAAHTGTSAQPSRPERRPPGSG